MQDIRNWNYCMYLFIQLIQSGKFIHYVFQFLVKISNTSCVLEKMTSGFGGGHLIEGGACYKKWCFNQGNMLFAFLASKVSKIIMN